MRMGVWEWEREEGASSQFDRFLFGGKVFMPGNGLASKWRDCAVVFFPSLLPCLAHSKILLLQWNVGSYAP
jgi:hypothetical protein